jgi:hypothetical protein
MSLNKEIRLNECGKEKQCKDRKERTPPGQKLTKGNKKRLYWFDLRCCSKREQNFKNKTPESYSTPSELLGRVETCSACRPSDILIFNMGSARSLLG